MVRETHTYTVGTTQCSGCVYSLMALVLWLPFNILLLYAGVLFNSSGVVYFTVFDWIFR